MIIYNVHTPLEGLHDRERQTNHTPPPPQGERRRREEEASVSLTQSVYHSRNREDELRTREGVLSLTRMYTELYGT